MTWVKIAYFTILIMVAGCTIKIEPIHKKPVKKYRHHHSTKAKSHRTPTPTPAPTVIPKLPLQLEPTESPTPFINIPPDAMIRTMEDAII